MAGMFTTAFRSLHSFNDFTHYEPQTTKPMKLLIILSVAEFADEVRSMMTKNNVPVYSETEMYGFRTEKHQPDIRAWFSQPNRGIYSTLFFSFQNEETVKQILKEVNAYNKEFEGDRDNPLHAYQVAVEDFA